MALPPVFVSFVGDWTGLKETTKEVKTGLAEVDAEGSNSMGRLGAVAKGALLGIGVAAIGAAYESLKLATSFQSAFTQIHTQAGVASSQMGMLQNGVLSLAGQVGFAPDSLAEALYHVESSFASVGITGPTALNILKVAAEGAAVGHADLVDVTNALDAAIASGIPGVENYSQAMGALNAIVGSGDMQMQDLADALGTGMLAVVKGYGLSLSDVGAALAVFGDNNIRGANAATDLRMAVQALAVPAAGSGAILKKLGINANTLAKDMQSGGLNKALTDLKTRMDKAGLGGKEMSQTLTELVGKKAGTGLDVLISQYDRLQSKYPELAKGAKGFDAAVAGNSNTLQQHIKNAQAALESLGTRAGMTLLPVATSLMSGISKGLAYLAAHTGVIKLMAVALGGLAVAWGVSAIAGAAGTVAAMGFDGAMVALTATMAAAGWPLLFMAIAVALYELVTHWKTVSAWLGSVWKATVKWLTEAWGDVVSAVKTAWREVVSIVMTYWNINKAIIMGAYNDLVKPVVDAFETMWHVSVTVFDAIAGFFRKWWPLLLVIFAFPIAVMMAAWNHFHQAVFHFAESAWNKVFGFLKATWGLIEKAAKAIWGPISDYIRFEVRLTTAIFLTAWRVTAAAALVVWHAIEKAASYVWGLIKAAIVNPAVDAYNKVKGLYDSFKSVISGAFNDALSFLQGIGSDFVSIGEDIVKGILKGIGNMAGSIGSALKSAAGGALHDVTSFLGISSPSRVFANEVGQWISKGVAQGVTDHAHVAVGAVRSMAGSLTGHFGGMSTGTSGMGGGTVIQNNVSLQVQGSVRADHDLRDLIQQELLRLGGRNISTWPSAAV
jgi:TP901 family phage tail tape measure protein